MHLLDLASRRNGHTPIDNIIHLFNPRPITPNMVKNVPILGCSACTLAQPLAPLWMPPATPARVVRLTRALVFKVAGV